MDAISLIFRKLTSNEFKAITNTINSDGGGSQTYIDFPKGAISDQEMTEFLGIDGVAVAKGYEWKIKVNSLSLGRIQQDATIKARRDSSNALREQNKDNRIQIWKTETSGFPASDYDEKGNPIVVYFLKDNNGELWAGWFYRNNISDICFLTKSLSTILYSDCGYVHFDTPICFDETIYDWPFMCLSKGLSVNPQYTKRPRQVIYFGAPGTGKSHAVNNIVKAEAPKRNVRTTFHPDTDYSSFVGCYKPTMRDGKIEYAFTAQAFINAYVGAWSDLSKPFYLVIEEINRGNCAQIFGDIFQLLDRDQEGESNYGIHPDTDLRAYISDKLSPLPNIPEEIRSGTEMRLPANLFIYATMNTSDQSLFPIDSAFKRRWDWRYTAIKPGNTDHTLVVGNLRYNWTSFIKKVNSKIYDLTKSEDKQLGYWFIKPDDSGDIDWSLFVSKAIFYIWNDIVKDYATMEKEDSAFGKKFAFSTFFDENGNPLIEQTIAFLETLGVEKATINAEGETAPDPDNSTQKRINVLISENKISLRAACLEITRQAIAANNLTFDAITEAAANAGFTPAQLNRLFLKEEDKQAWLDSHQADSKIQQRYYFNDPIISGDGVKFYVTGQGWMNIPEVINPLGSYAQSLSIPFITEE